jgi:hypothetical protein
MKRFQKLKLILLQLASNRTPPTRIASSFLSRSLNALICIIYVLSDATGCHREKAEGRRGDPGSAAHPADAPAPLGSCPGPLDVGVDIVIVKASHPVASIA